MQRQNLPRAETAGSSVRARVAELQARVERLIRANRELDDFASVVSHELKEPLAGIRAYCEILLEDYEDKFDAHGRARLSALVEMGDRLAASIDRLLAYSRIGRVPRGDTDVDLNGMVEAVLRTLRPTLDPQHAAVRVVGRLPLVKGDAVLIGQVFGNLISNGLKFNDDKWPRVEIGSLPGDPPAVYVRDNGIGIAQEYHQEVFAIFRRLHSPDKYEGFGAGLTIVRKIVESHGGRIWIESEPGRGTTFFFTLGPPSADAPTSEPGTRPPHWVGRPTRHAQRRKGRRSVAAKRGATRPTRVGRRPAG